MFTGKNINLRAVQKEDLVALNKIRNEEEVLENLSMWLPRPHSLEGDEYYFHEDYKKHSSDVEFVIEKKDGTPIGKCGTMDLEWKNSCVTVWIFLGGAENRGKGYGREALQLLVDYIFNEMNMNKVRLLVFAFNERGIKSYEKVGFKEEGRLKDEIFRHGKYHDVLQMSILRREYVKEV